MNAATDPPSRSSSRIRAPRITPVEHGGVRYEPLPAASSEGLAPGIYVKATEISSGRRLWTAKLHETVYDPRREIDVQNVFLRSLALEAAGSGLLAEDERGRRWRIQLGDGAVAALP